MKKYFLIILVALLLSGCIQTTAFIGPAVTIGASGNIYKTGLTTISNTLVKEVTGKDTAQHAIAYLESKDKKKQRKINRQLSYIAEKHFYTTREKLKKNN